MASGKFAPGRLVATPGALEAIGKVQMLRAFERHLYCDWGDVCAEDWKRNYYALKNGERLFSAYHAENGQKFWIITEADRSATTILLPEEY